MIKSLFNVAVNCSFDRVLAYACYTKISVEGKNYSFKSPTPHGVYANKISESDKFIDLSPGDIYLPAEDKVIPILRTLHLDPQLFPTPEINFSPTNEWNENYTLKLNKFLNDFENFVSKAVIEKEAKLDEVSITFTVQLTKTNLNDEIISYKILGGNTGREKIMRVKDAVMIEVLDKMIPFEDLYGGYLAEWKRKPQNIYNDKFLRLLEEYGYQYQNSKNG